jgi:hypothetical protein
LHFAARKSKVEILKKLWELGKKTLTAEALKINCY